MWDDLAHVLANRDFAIVIPQDLHPKADWYAPGDFVLIPLYWKRPLRIAKHFWVHAWTLHSSKASRDGWLNKPDDSRIRFPVVVRQHVRGSVLTIPIGLRSRSWLPGDDKKVMIESSSTEINLWQTNAYNLEVLHEADDALIE